MEVGSGPGCRKGKTGENYEKTTGKNNGDEDKLNLSQKGVSGSPSSLSASPCHDYDDGIACHDDDDN